MLQIIIGTTIISLLHAIIPSHWLPVIALSKQMKWSRAETLQTTLYLGLSHVTSTILLGIILFWLGKSLGHKMESFFELVVPIGLIIMGFYFMYRHHTHHHFHIDEQEAIKQKSKWKIISTLMLLMFFSPCLEIEANFLLAGQYSFYFVLLLSLVYAVISVTGMLLFVTISMHGLKKMNWHKIEHNAGLISGIILIVTGILSFFIH